MFHTLLCFLIIYSIYSCWKSLLKRLSVNSNLQNIGSTILPCILRPTPFFLSFFFLLLPEKKVQRVSHWFLGSSERRSPKAAAAVKTYDLPIACCLTRPFLLSWRTHHVRQAFSSHLSSPDSSPANSRCYFAPIILHLSSSRSELSWAPGTLRLLDLPFSTQADTDAGVRAGLYHSDLATAPKGDSTGGQVSGEL